MQCTNQTHVFSSANKTDSHDITEILLKVALNTITLSLSKYMCFDYRFGIRLCKLLDFSATILAFRIIIPVHVSSYRSVLYRIKYCLR